MLHSLTGLFETTLAPALAERLTLLLNHVLAAESVATDKLQPHAGRTLKLVLSGWPRLLPPAPLLAWRISAAGLLEWQGESQGESQRQGQGEGQGQGTGAAAGALADHTDLLVTVDASNPALLIARAMGGTAPAVQIDGDAQLAGDVNWLLQNLRWDLAADAERLFGPQVAQQLHLWGGALADGIKAAATAAQGAADAWRSRAGA
jgi:ubiquinone biosynthesis accessory factor UbiJ